MILVVGDYNPKVGKDAHQRQAAGQYLAHNMNMLNEFGHDTMKASKRRRNMYNLCIEGNSPDVVSKFRYLDNVINNEGA